MLSLCRKQTDFFNYIIVNRLHLQKVMRLNWLYVVLCFFVVQPSYAATTLLTGISKIAAGGEHTCALTTGGGVKCWGYNNSHGQLGDGTAVNSFIPIDVTELVSGVTAISAGDAYTCALTTNGAVKCWGGNEHGQLGNGTTVDSLIPVSVTGLTSGVTTISAGATHACALTTSGGVKCWGRNGSAELGNGSQTNSTVPVSVTGLGSGVSAISAGYDHTCALTTSGGVKCWGLKMGLNPRMNGNFGLVAAPYALIPEDVLESSTKGSLKNITAISAGYRATCALTASGGVKCWGISEAGQLGNGSNTHDEFFPVDTTGLTSGVKAISASSSVNEVYESNNTSAHTCALTNSAGVKCWGHYWDFLKGIYGHVGDYYDYYYSFIPREITGLNNVVAISAGADHTCAVVSGGGVKCWGFGGGLGDGTASTAITPVDVLATDPTTACGVTLNLGVTKTENSASPKEIPTVAICGGIQVKSGARQNKVVQNLSDDVDIRATIRIDNYSLSYSVYKDVPSYYGKEADLVVHAIYKPLNSTASLNFMLNESGAPILWEKTLVPFKSNVTLSKTQEVVMYKGKFVGTGQLLVYLGVRLKKDGIVISNSTPIDILINP